VLGPEAALAVDREQRSLERGETVWLNESPPDRCAGWAMRARIATIAPDARFYSPAASAGCTSTAGARFFTSRVRPVVQD
jgi:hypothetical protein